jgi:hypothetical protein
MLQSRVRWDVHWERGVYGSPGRQNDHVGQGSGGGVAWSIGRATKRFENLQVDGDNKTRRKR